MKNLGKGISSSSVLIKRKAELAKALKECRANPSRETAVVVSMASRDIFLEFVALSFMLGPNLPIEVTSVPEDLRRSIEVVARAARAAGDVRDKQILSRYARNEAVRHSISKKIMERDWEGFVHDCTRRIAWFAE